MRRAIRPAKDLPPPGTLRAIGIVVVAGGRAIDLALVESDGGDHVRRIELERIVLGACDDAISAAIRAFMGDRALQPFAVDILALGAGTAEATASALQRHLDIWTIIVQPGHQWPHLPEAERVALVAVPHYRAEIARGCAITAG